MYLFLNVGMSHYLFDYTVSSYFWYVRGGKEVLDYIILLLASSREIRY